MSEEGLAEWTENEFLNLTGKELKERSSVYVEEFSHGGMSSGIVTGCFL